MCHQPARDPPCIVTAAADHEEELQCSMTMAVTGSDKMAPMTGREADPRLGLRTTPRPYRSTATDFLSETPRGSAQ